jgi:hypothetical protein
MTKTILRILLVFISIFFLGITISFFAIYGGHIPSQDVLVCETKNGEFFILKSKYNFAPIGLIAGPVDSHQNQEPYRIYYQNKYAFLPQRLVPSINNYMDASKFSAACATVGFYKGYPISVEAYFENNAWIPLSHDIEDKLISASTFSTSLKTQLEKYDYWANISYAFVVPTGKYLLIENPLITSDYKILAVISSKSFDDGKTWQEPVVTEKAEMFEVGKSLFDQSFIAHPVSFNSRPIFQNN